MIRQQVIPNCFGGHHEVMPKHAQKSMDADAFSARLVELLKERGQQRHGAGAYLHRKYKVSTVTANAWLNGTHKADPEMARRIAEDHGTTFEALYFGGGKPVNLSRYDLTPATEDDGAIPIEMLNVRGSCGGGSINWDAENRLPLMKEPSWFRRYNLRPSDGLAVWADGDSMADFIVDGDIVIFDTSKTTPKSGRIFLIEHPDGLRIKRLRRGIDGAWILESGNPDKRHYPDDRIDPADADMLKIRGEFIYRQGG